MAKVLKVFVNLILILFILTGLALLVPPLVGVTTLVAEEGMVTNMQTGSVAYGLSTPVSELGAGDKILWSEDGAAYVYEIVSLDAETGEAAVQTAEGASSQELSLGNNVQREVITVPLIGYVSIAMQTMEGRIILGLAALLIIVLFIVAEVWSRRSEEAEEEDEEEEEDGEEELSRRERKAREKERKRRAREKKRLDARGEGEEDQFFQELADKKRAADAARNRKIQEETESSLAEAERETERKPVPEQDAEVFIQRVDGFAPEEEEETAAGAQAEEQMSAAAEMTEAFSETEEEEEPAHPEMTEDAGTEEAERPEEAPAAEAAEEPEHPEAAADAGKEAEVQETEENPEVRALEEALARASDSQEVGTDTIPNVQAALEAALEVQQISHPVQVPETEFPEAAEETDELPEEIELAMPVKSVEELLQEAYTDGDDPVLREDETTGIKFVDFSDCL